MSQVTVVFPVKNEAANLCRALPPARALGPVLVVDSESADDTASVARRLGAEVIQFRWDGRFPKKRNWVLRHHRFETPWVLFLDADELVSPAFVAEVGATIPDTPHAGFWLNFEKHFLGRRLLHGDPMRKLALFRVGAGEYERIDEDRWSHLDMEVHEHPIVQGTVGEIHTPIAHDDDRGLKHSIEKHNEYSSWEAERYWRLRGSACRQAWAGLTRRQRTKYRHLDKWWLAPAFFLASYILRGGFRDGSAGFHFALQKTIYFYQIRLKILEKSSGNRA